VPLPEAPRKRDLRIDFLRGLALVMIFINHIPGTIWENFTSRNFGFSDAAEGFVLMSGIATGLAYGMAFLRPNTPLADKLRPCRRALTLWVVHVAVVMVILGIFLLTVQFPAVAEMAYWRNILAATEAPLAYLLPLILLGHQFAYADILPLYVLLMLVAPVILALAVRWPSALMAGSLGLWFLAGLFQIRMPTWPGPNGWFFNPLSWQVLFVAGVLLGLALREGRRWLPLRAWAVWLAGAYLILAAVWVQVPVVAAYGGHGLWLVQEYLWMPKVFTTFDKTFLCLPRLLHILALAYVLSALPALTRLSQSTQMAPFVLLGRHALPVFAVSSVLAYGAQVLKALTPASFIMDTALIAGGLLVLYAVAVRGEQPRLAHRAKGAEAAAQRA
jgi:hypothetical protein